MSIFGKIGSALNPFDGGGSILDPLGIGGSLFGGGGGGQSAAPGGPAPVDYSASLEAMAESSQANMAMFVGGQVQQTQMQTNMMNMMGMRMQMMEQGKLDTKLEIAGMKQEADMQEAQYRHDEHLIELLNSHIEELVDDGMIDPDSLA